MVRDCLLLRHGLTQRLTQQRPVPLKNISTTEELIPEVKALMALMVEPYGIVGVVSKIFTVVIHDPSRKMVDKNGTKS